MVNSPERQVMANAIRALSMDAVEAAKSGHPGMPMGMADAATALFADHLKFDASAPDWPDRDRFVLSAGHGSMLIYSLLHLSGYADMTMDQLRNFRQVGAITAGHPKPATPAGSRRPPARSARVWRMPSAWRWPSTTWLPSMAATLSTTTPMSSRATAA